MKWYTNISINCRETTELFVALRQKFTGPVVRRLLLSVTLRHINPRGTLHTLKVRKHSSGELAHCY